MGDFDCCDNNEHDDAWPEDDATDIRARLDIEDDDAARFEANYQSREAAKRVIAENARWVLRLERTKPGEW